MALSPQSQRRANQIGDSKFIIFSKFKKMNTKVARQNLPEDEVSWMENLQPIADNDLLTVPGAATALSNIGADTVSRFFPTNIGAVDYIITFTVSGKCFATNAATGANIVIAGTPGTFSAFPDMTVFASSRILIMDPVGGYATWDGTLFVKSGGISPNIHITAGGSGYSSPPAVTFTGGAGGNAGGAAATAVISNGSVVAINVTNAGTGNAAGAAITVVLTGGGFSVAATATVVVWPQVTGNTITVFGGRVWWASAGPNGNFRILNFTGTGATTGQTFDDINPADAAGSTSVTDADLVHNITALRALNNFLYIFGDQSIKQIGSITVSSSITLFTILTLSSDVGTSFLMSIQSYNRIVLMANKNGVYGIFGATVQKISDDLDGIFQLTDFTLQPSSALNDLSNIHCYLLLLKYLDPIAGTRNIMVMFQKDKWFVVSQGSLIAICSLPLASTTQVETFGSSGSDVTQLLQNKAVAVPITLITSLTSHGNYIIAKKLVRSGIAVTTQTAQNLTMTVDTENGNNSYQFQASSVVNWVNNLGQVVQFQNNTPTNVNFITGGFRFPYTDTEGYGKFIGNTVTGLVANLSVNAIANEYTDADLWGNVP
jgi:hypothetical protein